MARSHSPASDDDTFFHLSSYTVSANTGPIAEGEEATVRSMLFDICHSVSQGLDILCLHVNNFTFQLNLSDRTCE